MLGFFAKRAEHRDILKETFELPFELPPYRQKENKLPDAVQLWEQLDTIVSDPVHLLVELNHFLYELNRTYIGGDKRYSITLRCMDYASPAIRHIFFEHQKGKALPENPAKREALIAAVKSVQELSNSFKRIIKNEYKTGGKTVKPPTRRVRQSMIVVLQLIHTEQRLKALRYLKLSAMSWRDCNSLFFLLQATGNTRKPIKSMGLNVNRSSPSDSMAKSVKTTVEELYVLIQLFGLVDPNSLSLQQAVIVDNYLKPFLPQLHFDELSEEKLPAKCIMTGFAHDGPPVLQEDSCVSAHILAMDIKPLTSSVKIDCQRLFAQLKGENDEKNIEAKADSDRKSGHKKPATTGFVHRLEDIERLLALYALSKKLRETERSDTRKYSDQTQEVYVYNGFTAGFHMLNANKMDINESIPLQNQLKINLAQRSASIADNAQADKLTQWEIVNQSAGGLLLRTKETQYINNLFIGQLIIFAKSKTALLRPSCGCVVRICRNSHNNIEVSLKILASQIESVVVQTEILQKNAMGMPGVMIFDAGVHLQLVMHQSHRLLPGSRVTIQRSHNRYDYCIGEIEFVQREFIVYQLK
ncbi:hypothetical protein [Kaarinaea lacus]